MTAREAWLQKHLEQEQRDAAASGTGHKSRVVTALAKRILLAGDVACRGYLLTPKAKSLGAGVYEITWERTD